MYKIIIRVRELDEEQYQIAGHKVNKVKKIMKGYATNFLKKNYGLDLEIPIHFSYADSKYVGQYIYNEPDNVLHPIEIMINSKILYYTVIFEDLEFSLQTLKHELIHYALSVQGLDHNDGDELFERELIKYNVSTSDGKKEKNLEDAIINRKSIQMVDVYEVHSKNYEFNFIEEVAHKVNPQNKKRYSDINAKGEEVYTYQKRSLIKITVNIF